MKSIGLIFWVLILLLSLNLSAQIHKRSFLVEGGINLSGNGQPGAFIGTTGISFRSTDNYAKNYTNGITESYLARKYFNYSIAPRIGYVVLNNLVIGADFQYSKNTYRLKDYDYSTHKNRSVLYGTYIRQYFGNGKFLPLIEAGIGWGLSKNISDETSPGGGQYQGIERRDLFYFSGAAGFSYAINSKLSINLQAKAQQTEEKPINTENFHFGYARITNFDTALVLSFGYILFQKKGINTLIN
jgi:hypothetical protein